METLKNIGNIILDVVIFAGTYFFGGIIIVPFILGGTIVACYVFELIFGKL